MDAKDPIRKRIVINLDAPAGQAGYAAGRPNYPASRKVRRWPKVLAILFVIIIMGVAAVAVGGYLYWRHYQSTPAYSIALLIDAAQHNDMAAFQKQIDDDSIAKNMVTEVSQKASSRYGIALSPALQKQVDTMVPTLMPRLKDTIHQEVAKEIKEFAAKSDPKPFIVVALAVPTIVKITTEGDKAKATALLPNRQIELGLQRDGDLWKVTQMKDDELVNRVVDSVMKDLPPIGSNDAVNGLLKALRKPNKK